MKLAQLTKKQRDAAFRQQQQDPAKGAIITTDETGAGSVSNPSSDLAAHKSSADHDGRYYTQAEIDTLLAGVGTGGEGAFDFGLITNGVDITQDWGGLT